MSNVINLEKATTLQNGLQILYDKEINCGMQSFWDNGFDVWLGDDMNGIHITENFRGDQMDKAAKWLYAQAHKFYPDAGLE